MLLGSGLGLGGSLGGLLGRSLSGSLGSLGSGLLLVLGGTLGLLGGLGLALGLLGSGGLGGLGLAGGLGSSGLLELGGSGATELVGEALDASTGVDELLLAGVERVALVAQVNRQRGDGRAGDPGVAAAAADGALDVVGVDTILHEQDSFLLRAWFRPGSGCSRVRARGMLWFPTRAYKPLNGSMAPVPCHEKVAKPPLTRARLHAFITLGVAMFLAIDVGNSQTTVGLFESGTVQRHWRLKTDRLDTADELHAQLRSFLALEDIALENAEGVAVASVVPQLTAMWRRALIDATGSEPFIVNAAAASAMRIDMPYPEQVGADRIANAVEAHATYGAPAIVVDFGTATNIDVVDASGSYRGGCIAPGLMLSASALFEKAAKLSSIPIEVPPAPIGDTTEHALQSGLVLGAAAQAEGLVARIKAQLAREQDAEKIDCPVIATGGLGGVVGQATDVFDAVDVDLTLRGIWRIWQQAR